MVAEQKWDIWSGTKQIFVVRVPFLCNGTNLVLLDNKTRYWGCINLQIMHFSPSFKLWCNKLLEVSSCNPISFWLTLNIIYPIFCAIGSWPTFFWPRKSLHHEIFDWEALAKCIISMQEDNDENIFFGRGGCDNYGMTPAWAISWGGINKLQKRILMMPSTTFIGHQVLLEAPEVLKLPLEVWQRVQILILGLLNGINKSIEAVREMAGDCWSLYLENCTYQNNVKSDIFFLGYPSYSPSHSMIKISELFCRYWRWRDAAYKCPVDLPREGCGDEHQHSLGHNVNPHGRYRGRGRKEHRICQFTNDRCNIYVLSELYSCPWPSIASVCN